MVSDPLDALLLWVNDEWPTLTGGQNDSILSGHPIIWQTLVVPGSHSGIVCKHEDWIQTVCQGYRDLEQKQRNDVSIAETLSFNSQTMLWMFVVYSVNKCSLNNAKYGRLTF